MNGRIFAAVLMIAAGVGWAQEPAPTTRPAPTTQPTRLPSPAELIRRMKMEEKQREMLPKVAFFDLSGSVVEKPPGFQLFASDNIETLHSLLVRIHQAKEDASVRAVLMIIGSTDLHLAQAQEVRDALMEVRSSGKPVFVYADAYDTDGYTIATGASDICMLEGGEMMLPGVGFDTIFAKGLLDKVGVQADYIQIGEYKGADEQFTRTTPSDQLRGELNKLIDSLYAQIVDGIAKRRNLPAQAVKEAIDQTLLTGRTAKQRGLVDHLVDADGLRDLVAKRLGAKEITLLHDYGRPTRDSVDLGNPFALFHLLMARTPVQTSRPSVGMIYAQGVIVDGESRDGLFGSDQVGSEDLRRAFRLAERDENIKAVVLRIDSPGGSALASEVMWQAARRLAKKKPLIVSIGGMAASGGYYLASAGDTLMADPSAIVGSIGVVGGKFVLKGLFDKLGLSETSFTRGANAALFSSSQPFTDTQRKMVRSWMQDTYEQFTQRVMTTRTGKIKDIDQVAHGRVFVATQAKALGMVDRLGGTEAAIRLAADRAALEPDTYDVRVIPAPKTLADLLNGGDGPDAKTPLMPKVALGPDTLLGALDPDTRHLMMQELSVLHLLQQRPVLLVSPYVLTEK